YINNNGNIFLFNKDNINENDYIWEVKLDLKNQPLNEAEFAYNSSDIFILVNRRYLYSLNIDNGNINWKYDYKSLSESHLLLHDDSIYLSSIDGTLTDIDANKGIINWIYNGFGSVSDDRIIRKNERINLAIKCNILIYTPYNGGTHAIDPRKGNLLWNIDFTDYIKDKNKDKNLKDIFDIKPYIFDANGIKKVIIGSSNGSFLCVTLKGELEWINDFGSKTKPFFINNNIFVFSKDEIKIFDINKQNNYHNLWKIKFKNLQSNSYNGIKEGFIVNNEILLITKNNEFLKFNPYAKDDELVINYENHDNLNGYHIAMGNIYIY
ncbi:MAG: PQQ-like beta-propeller repeat protein, partial [Anaplasmataceae bacterium]|nr:PQQ-like beta-propeller repeat protein [Anaplasmataceae bacterium]